MNLIHKKSKYIKPLILILWLLFPAVNLLAQSSSEQPVLRIETGMHTAPIGKISKDLANRYLVTASEDKTARIWDLQSGELLRVLRVPIGEGDEGMLYAAAMSPDGNTIAVGGRIGVPNKRDIYLFDRASGKLLNRIQGLPGVVLDLTFSPDGKYLAASLGLKGVRLFETRTFQQIGEDTDYGSRSLWVDFDSTGNKMATSCADGYLRLYQVSTSGLTLLTKKNLADGKEPYSPKFSPDGSKIAVGFSQTQVIHVVSANDLGILYSPSIKDHRFFSVAWSKDGSKLFMGLTYDFQVIRSWDDGGRGNGHQNAVQSFMPILTLLPLPNNEVVWGSSDHWGIVGVNLKEIKTVRKTAANFQYNSFNLSEDATEFQFTYYPRRNFTTFSLLEKRLKELGAEPNNRLWPVTETLNITDWFNKAEPKLNGVKLLKENELSLSLAITSDAGKFLLGTVPNLRLFDSSGRELWKVQAPSAVYSVNVSKDGRLGLAAFGDGTIRWYRMTDGRELLAFFPHIDGKRWVIWTPGGYYDVSPDGEELVGWHANNGAGAAADFYPVGLFRNRFYRPDVVAKILSTLDETVALNLADKEAGRKSQEADIAKQLPPVVEITSPRDGTEVSNSTVKIGYSIRTGSGEPVTNIKVLIDGRPQSDSRGAGNRPTAGTSEVTVTIPEKDSEVAIIAENRFAPSVPAIVKLKWKNATVAAGEFVVKPKLYILAIGVSKYQNADFNLGFAAKDARDFAAAMQAQQGGLYREVVVKSLTDTDATRDNIVDGLDWIRLQTTAKDVAMVFIAGHGTNDTLNRYYFLPHNYNPDRLSSTGVTFTDIKNAVEAIAGKAVFFVDTCHSGNALGTAKTRGLPDINGLVNELSSAENGAVVFAASTGKQVSLEDVSWNNGAFTKAVVEGMGGKAEIPGKGKITINSLDLYISERVKELTGGQQTPTTAKPNTVPDFPVAVRK